MRENVFLPNGKGVAEYPKMSFTCALKFSPWDKEKVDFQICEAIQYFSFTEPFNRRQHPARPLLYHKLAALSSEWCKSKSYLKWGMIHLDQTPSDRGFVTMKNSKKHILHHNLQYSYTQLRQKFYKPILTMYSGIIYSVSVFWNAGCDPLILIFQFSKRLQVTVWKILFKRCFQFHRELGVSNP